MVLSSTRGQFLASNAQVAGFTFPLPAPSPDVAALSNGIEHFTTYHVLPSSISPRYSMSVLMFIALRSSMLASSMMTSYALPLSFGIAILGSSVFSGFL